MENCNTNTNVIPDNTPLSCDEYISTECVLHPTALANLGLPANASQQDINTAINLALINANNKILQLEAQECDCVVFTDASIEIDGTYNLQASDDKKYIYVTSAINNPRIAINSVLPDGFQCYFFYQPAPYDMEVSVPEELVIEAEVTTTPLFTVPEQNRTRIMYYGAAFIKKKNINLYTATGDLDYPSS